MKNIVILTVSAFAAVCARADAPFVMDKSVMSEKYWQIWNDDVQKQVDENIERNRKADAAIEIDAADGTEVEIKQVSHAFYFGAHIFNFNQLGRKEYNERYKELYGTLFNSFKVAVDVTSTSLTIGMVLSANVPSAYCWTLGMVRYISFSASGPLM